MRNKNVNSVVLSLGINSHHDFDFNFNLMVFLTLRGNLLGVASFSSLLVRGVFRLIVVFLSQKTLSKKNL